jgi:hypothetical protein
MQVSIKCKCANELWGYLMWIQEKVFAKFCKIVMGGFKC